MLFKQLALPSTPVLYLSDEEAGESIKSKLDHVRQAIEKEGCDSYVVTTLDSICWLLNIRGDDIQYNPYVYSYVFIEKEKMRLFIHEGRIPENHPHFAGVDLVIHKYDEFYDFLEKVEGKVCYDKNKINWTILKKLEKQKPKQLFW